MYPLYAFLSVLSAVFQAGTPYLSMDEAVILAKILLAKTAVKQTMATPTGNSNLNTSSYMIFQSYLDSFSDRQNSIFFRPPLKNRTDPRSISTVC